MRVLCEAGEGQVGYAQGVEVQGEEAYVQSTESYVHRTMPVYVGAMRWGGGGEDPPRRRQREKEGRGWGGGICG